MHQEEDLTFTSKFKSIADSWRDALPRERCYHIFEGRFASEHGGVDIDRLARYASGLRRCHQ